MVAWADCPASPFTDALFRLSSPSLLVFSFLCPRVRPRLVGAIRRRRGALPRLAPPRVERQLSSRLVPPVIFALVCCVGRRGRSPCSMLTASMLASRCSPARQRVAGARRWPLALALPASAAPERHCSLLRRASMVASFLTKNNVVPHLRRRAAHMTSATWIVVVAPHRARRAGAPRATELSSWSAPSREIPS